MSFARHPTCLFRLASTVPAFLAAVFVLTGAACSGGEEEKLRDELDAMKSRAIAAEAEAAVAAKKLDALEAENKSLESQVKSEKSTVAFLDQALRTVNEEAKKSREYYIELRNEYNEFKQKQKEQQQ